MATEAMQGEPKQPQSVDLLDPKHERIQALYAALVKAGGRFTPIPQEQRPNLLARLDALLETGVRRWKSGTVAPSTETDPATGESKKVRVNAFVDDQIPVNGRAAPDFLYKPDLDRLLAAQGRLKPRIDDEKFDSAIADLQSGVVAAVQMLLHLQDTVRETETTLRATERLTAPVQTKAGQKPLDAVPWAERAPRIAERVMGIEQQTKIPELAEENANLYEAVMVRYEQFSSLLLEILRICDQRVREFVGTAHPQYQQVQWLNALLRTLAGLNPERVELQAHLEKLRDGLRDARKERKDVNEFTFAIENLARLHAKDEFERTIEERFGDLAPDVEAMMAAFDANVGKFVKSKLQNPEDETEPLWWMCKGLLPKLGRFNLKNPAHRTELKGRLQALTDGFNAAADRKAFTGAIDRFTPPAAVKAKPADGAATDGGNGKLG